MFGMTLVLGAHTMSRGAIVVVLHNKITWFYFHTTPLKRLKYRYYTKTTVLGQVVIVATLLIVANLQQFQIAFDVAMQCCHHSLAATK
jgi:hypothetical protein